MSTHICSDEEYQQTKLRKFYIRNAGSGIKRIKIFNWAAKVGYDIDVTLSISPFSNCQVATLGNAQAFKYCNDTPMLNRVVATIINNANNKKVFVIDIHTSIVEEVIGKLEHLLSNSFTKKVNYTSTNGTRMTICVLRFNATKIVALSNRLVKLKLLRGNKYLPNSTPPSNLLPPLSQQTKEERRKIQLEQKRRLKKRLAAQAKKAQASNTVAEHQR